jgi:hypothetical protein
MVVAKKLRDYGIYKMNIYDLEAVKNPKRTEDELLVQTLSAEFNFDKISADETTIIYEKSGIIRILDFSSFDCFRNSANSVTLSLPWRSVWRSKGVDEEPLEPGRHMEVYREVLQYSGELRMKCQSAIKCCPVVGPDRAWFKLGADLIGSRELTVLVIYDENAGTRPRDMEFKTLQISKNTQVSVMAMRIQLIDVTTGNIINEMRLTSDAIGFHFGRNLLLFVSKMAHHEHLLSVWSVDNSLNLTHIKDVPIGDYDRYARDSL